uniref:Uncharacterized protein n=1 Tax=Vitis vinifera TaxID=29760 RepID=A5AZ47_VITVI|nr:hypothetical protein VITISV_029692 [Vitis vinifera]
MSVANIGRLQEPFRRRKMVSTRFRRHSRGLRNNFATPSYLHKAAKLASTLRFLASFSRHKSCIVRRRNTLLYKNAAKSLRNKRVISQHFAKCFLQLGVIGLTLAINSNQIVLSFGVLIAFLLPKQSEIEESSLKIHGKDVRTRSPDTPSEGGGTQCFPSGQHIRIGYAIVRMEFLWIAWRRVSSWEIRMELIRIALRTPCHPGEGSLHLAHADDDERLGTSSLGVKKAGLKDGKRSFSKLWIAMLNSRCKNGDFGTFHLELGKQLRNHLIGGLQGENWDLDNKYLKQNIKKRWSQISGSTQENFAGAQNGCEISQMNKMAAKSFRSRRLISQPKADFAALRNWPSAWNVSKVLPWRPLLQNYKYVGMMSDDDDCSSYANDHPLMTTMLINMDLRHWKLRLPIVVVTCSSVDSGGENGEL